MELRQEELVAIQEAAKEAQIAETSELLDLRLVALGSSGLAEVTLV